MKPHRRIDRARPTAGFTLIEVLAAATLLAGLGIVATQMMSFQLKTTRKISSNLDRTGIVQRIQSGLDCQNTANAIVPAQVASSSVCDLTLVDVYDHNGRLMISHDQNNPTKIGDWTVRALCRYSATVTASNGIDIEIAQPKPGIASPLTQSADTSFNADPVTGKAYGWYSMYGGVTKYPDAQVYPPGAWPCAAELAANWAGPPVVVPPPPPHTPPLQVVVIARGHQTLDTVNGPNSFADHFTDFFPTPGFQTMAATCHVTGYYYNDCGWNVCDCAADGPPTVSATGVTVHGVFAFGHYIYGGPAPACTGAATGKTANCTYTLTLFGYNPSTNP